MSITQTPQTFARTITVCAECGGEIAYLVPFSEGPYRIVPCGHDAALKVKPNPKLCAP